jgi:hypothetical protein
LCCLFFFDIRILISPLVSFGHCVVCSSSIYGFWLPLWYLLAIVLSVLLRYTDSDCPFGIFWPLCCLFFFDIQILIAPLVSSNSSNNALRREVVVFVYIGVSVYNKQSFIYNCFNLFFIAHERFCSNALLKTTGSR